MTLSENINLMFRGLQPPGGEVELQGFLARGRWGGRGFVASRIAARKDPEIRLQRSLREKVYFYVPSAFLRLAVSEGALEAVRKLKHGRQRAA